MSRPEPRPALKRADDGAVHPAAPRVAAERHIHPAPHAPATVGKEGKEGKPGQGMKAAVDEPPPAVVFDGKPVTLSVEVPKPLRKQLRKVAERDGRSVDDVVVDALTRYLVG